MCGIIIFTNQESVDRYWEWKMAARERRRKFLQKALPCLRPAVKEDQPRAPEQVDQSPEQGTPPRYASATSLLPSGKVVE
jgi:hypothetical protein